MAVLWVCRKMTELDPSKAATGAMKQATVERLAKDLGLEVSFEVLLENSDMGVRGSPSSLSPLFEKMYYERLRDRLTVDCKEHEYDDLSKLADKYRDVIGDINIL